MLQLKETDFLWKCYRKYYDCGPEDQPPHPHSVCSYWWTSVGGMHKWVFFDANFFIVAFLAIALFVGNWILLTNMRGHGGWPMILGVFLGIFEMFFGFWMLFFFCCRSDAFNKKHFSAVTAAKLSWVIISTVILLLFSSIFSLSFVTKDEPWEWIFLLHGFLCMLGIFLLVGLLVILVMFFSTNNVLKAYLWSFKDWVCPLVKAPWEEKNDKKE